jgi:hypothetical protein
VSRKSLIFETKFKGHKVTAEVMTALQLEMSNRQKQAPLLGM